MQQSMLGKIRDTNTANWANIVSVRHVIQFAKLMFSSYPYFAGKEHDTSTSTTQICWFRSDF